MITEELEITLYFSREIEDGAEVNERGKDHLYAEIESIDGDDALSQALIRHIHDETGIDVREHGIGEYAIMEALHDGEL